MKMNRMHTANRILALLLIALMVLSLAACGTKGGDKMDGMSSEPKNAEEAAAMHKELMAQAMKYAQCRLSVPTLDQVAAAALYTVGPDYFAAVREEYKRRRDTVVNKLHEIPGVVCECPRGAFYIMAALPVDDADAFQKWLLEEFEDNGDTVMFAPGEPFYGTPGKGKNEIRIAYVLKQADLERAMDLLAKGIAAYNAR